MVAGPVWGQGLVAAPFERDVPVSVREDQPWSWQGLPQGAQRTCGVPYELSAATPEGVAAGASPVTLERPAAVVYALLSPVVPNHLASIEFHCGNEGVTVRAKECALAWASPEPRKRRLLLARGEAPAQKAITRVTPRGCYLFALVAGDETTAKDGKLAAAYTEGQQAWAERYEAELPPLYRLERIAESVPDGRIAVLPPRGGEPAVLTRALAVTGLRQKLIVLQGEDLLDPERFSAARFPIALCVGNERHLRTIREPNDAADAVVRYLAEGGVIIMATSMPYPTYYAIDAGAPAPIPNQPLLRRLGIDITAGFERPPEGSKLTIHPVEGQTALPSLLEGWDYPTTGDLRLRCFGVREGEASKATPLIEVRNADGSRLGVCGALFELSGPEHPAGTILYIWGGVMNDGRVADNVAYDLIRWIAARLEGVSDAP